MKKGKGIVRLLSSCLLLLLLRLKLARSFLIEKGARAGETVADSSVRDSLYEQAQLSPRAVGPSEDDGPRHSASLAYGHFT